MNHISARLDPFDSGSSTYPVRTPKLTNAPQAPHLFRMQDRVAQENDAILQTTGKMLCNMFPIM